MARQTIKTYCNLSDRPTKQKLMAAIGVLQGLYDVSLEPRRPTRSSAANRFYWGVVVQSLTDFLAAQGESYSPEQVHEMMKSRLLEIPVVNHDTGEVVCRTTKSTAKMDTAAFSDYLENTIAWLGTTFGIELPSQALYTEK